MENKSHALGAGLFTIALGIAMVLAVMWFNRDGTERMPYELATRTSISGLSPQSAVRYRGLDVGKVESIDFDPKVPGQILIRIAVDKDTPMTRGTFAQLGYQGVTGLAYILLDDDGTNPARLASSAEAVQRIELRPGTFDKLASKGEQLMNQLEHTIQSVNALLSPANQKILTDTLISLDSAAKELAAIGPALQPTLEQLPDLAVEARKTLMAVSRTAQDFHALAERLQRRDGTFDQLDDSLGRLAILADSVNQSTLPRFNALAEDTTRGARALTRSLHMIEERPQSLLFGAGAIPPGPGEAGFTGGR